MAMISFLTLVSLNFIKISNFFLTTMEYYSHPSIVNM